VLTAVLVLGILSGVAIQDWTVIEKREKEAQLLFLQEQYAAAILSYQRGQGALPTTLEQLTKKGQTGQVYLRRPWVDPMTRNAKLTDWCLWQVGPGGQVASSCAVAQDQTGNSVGAELTETDDIQSKLTPKDANPTATGRRGPAQAAQNPQLQQPAGLLSGAVVGAIVGVHSKSDGRAYNTAKRGEEKYNLWRYTIEDYKNEMAARSVPGMPQKPRMNVPGAQAKPTSKL
jgi:type II secretory pathway pseudopilin PulG